MIRGAVVAALGAAIGCHSGGPTKIPGPALAVDAELIDPSTAALLAALRDQRDRACACTERGCAEDADALAVQWGMDHRHVVTTAEPSSSQQREASDLIAAGEDCLDRWLRSPSP